MAHGFEARGYRITVKEYFSESQDPGDYYATVLAEKLVRADSAELERSDKARRPDPVADKRFGYFVKTFWWIIVLLGIFIYLCLTSPFLAVLKAAFQ